MATDSVIAWKGKTGCQESVVECRYGTVERPGSAGDVTEGLT